jgi:hypothetical protein
VYKVAMKLGHQGGDRLKGTALSARSLSREELDRRSQHPALYGEDYLKLSAGVN